MKNVVLSVVMASVLSCVGCGTVQQQNGSSALKTTQDSSKLSVLYAGSLTKVMEQTVGPDVSTRLQLDMQGEGKGSEALAQMIKAGLSRPDVFISASPAVNTNLLMGDQNQHLESWYLPLAEDQLVIAYAPTSSFREKLDAAAHGAAAWYKVIDTKGFRFGRTDPQLDPKGASTILMFKLAEQYYHQPGLKQKSLGSDENPNQVFPEETLLAQLTSGQLDATVAYKHEAVEWGVPYITLPDAVNLGNVKFAKQYAKVSFQAKDGSVKKGSPVEFTISIPKTVSNLSGAEAFVRYMVSGHGHDILIKDGFTAVPTHLVGNLSDLPAGLQTLVQR